MDAELLLRNLGVAGNLKGFRYAAYMIGLAEENPDAVTRLPGRVLTEFFLLSTDLLSYQ